MAEVFPHKILIFILVEEIWFHEGNSPLGTS